MSAIWENHEIKEKILLLSPELQESFLRAVDALHCRESSFMLTFIKESRDELRDTHQEIEREQEVLRDTSDLLASKRIYGDPDEWEDNMHEMNAVEDYLKRRNNGELGGLGLLTIEDENKARKKAKKKEKEKKERRNKSRQSERTDTSMSVESHGGELFGMVDETEKESSKKDKKEKKKKDKKEKTAIIDQQEDEAAAEKPEKKEKKKEKKEATMDVAGEETEAPSKKEKKKKKDKHRDTEAEAEPKREKTTLDVDDESQATENAADKAKEEEKERKREEKEKRKEEKERKKLQEKSRHKSEEVLGGGAEDGLDLLRVQREKSAPLLTSREATEVEKETNVLMQEFLTRQTTDIDQKAQFEEAMQRKLAKKRNPHAAEADQLLKQQAWADEARDNAKANYEAKMMEKLKQKREKSGLTSREMSSLDEPGSIEAEKPKKEKKKKKNKDKDKEVEEDADAGEEKEKKKKKKKDKDRDREDD